MFFKRLGVNASYKQIVLPLFIFAGVFFIYDYFQIKDPKYYLDLGEKASLTRDIPAEIKNYKKAVYYCNKDLSKYRALVLPSYRWLATAYMHKSELGKSEKMLLEGLKFSDEYYGPYSKQTLSMYDLLGLYASYDKKFDKSAGYYLKYLEINEKLYPKDKERLAYICRNISKLYNKAGNDSDSMEFHNKAQQYFVEKILKLSMKEKEFIKSNLKQVTHFLRMHFEFEGEWQLSDLDLGLKHWQLSDNSNKMSSKAVKNVLGSALGHYLEKRYNMSWYKLQNPNGTTFICRDNEDMRIEPFGYVSKIINEKDHHGFSSLDAKLRVKN